MQRDLESSDAAMRVLDTTAILAYVTTRRNKMDGMHEIADVLARVRNPTLLEGFLDAILTKNEAREIAGRWELVKLLNEGHTQRHVAERLGMSLCKITRGSRELKKENSALKCILCDYTA